MKRERENKKEKEGKEKKGERGEGRREGERKYSFFSSARAAPLTNFHVQSTIFKILTPAAGRDSDPRSARI